MVKIINNSIESFEQEVKDKMLYVFGAGRRMVHLYEELKLQGKIVCIIDNNEKLQGTTLKIGEEDLPIIGMGQFFLQLSYLNTQKVLLLITQAFAVFEIIEQLDQREELDGVRCYVGNLLMEHYDRQEFSFTKGNIKIPKKIHYCWFGKKEMPQRLRDCVHSWERLCPDYEIVRWDESNYDVSKNRYMESAYKAGKWGFVPDYARLDIIYQEGGIYLDTDVELLKSLDDLLCDDMFCCADGGTIINFGVGFGAVKGNLLIKEMRDFYEDKVFQYEDGSLNLAPCYMYQNPVLKNFGFEIRNRYQKINSMVIYPSEVLAPTGIRGMEDYFTEKTIAVHHSELSWINEVERKQLEEYKSKIEKRLECI